MTTVAAALGIVPALGLLYLTLYRFEGYFNEKRVFGTLFGGMVLGFVVAIIEALAQPLYYVIPEGSETGELDIFMAVSFMVMGFAFLEQLAKLALLNMKRFQNKVDTPFYGASVGMGFGALYVLISLGRSPVLLSGDIKILLVYGSLISLGALLFHSATGAWLGYGVAKGKKGGYLAYSVMAQLPFNGVLLLNYFYVGLPPLYVPLGLFCYGFMVWLYIYKVVLPEALPKELVDRHKRERRRGIRKSKLGMDGENKKP
ncbi:MAG: hypothetical protein CVT48_05930 [Thermoplasmata archaeon HGW-Thermoplasmata-1]|nr:MAG: hypothetical protein CVT48_05930 [Thermoplasmata archaeon HGW-Thermoplasmata-1]